MYSFYTHDGTASDKWLNERVWGNISQLPTQPHNCVECCNRGNDCTTLHITAEDRINVHNLMVCTTLWKDCAIFQNFDAFHPCQNKPKMSISARTGSLRACREISIELACLFSTHCTSSKYTIIALLYDRLVSHTCMHKCAHRQASWSSTALCMYISAELCPSHFRNSLSQPLLTSAQNKIPAK